MKKALVYVAIIVIVGFVILRFKGTQSNNMLENALLEHVESLKAESSPIDSMILNINYHGVKEAAIQARLVLDTRDLDFNKLNTSRYKMGWTSLDQYDLNYSASLDSVFLEARYSTTPRIALFDYNTLVLKEICGTDCGRESRFHYLSITGGNILLFKRLGLNSTIPVSTAKQ